MPGRKPPRRAWGHRAPGTDGGTRNSRTRSRPGWPRSQWRERPKDVERQEPAGRSTSPPEAGKLPDAESGSPAQARAGAAAHAVHSKLAGSERQGATQARSTREAVSPMLCGLDGSIREALVGDRRRIPTGLGRGLHASLLVLGFAFLARPQEALPQATEATEAPFPTLRDPRLRPIATTRWLHRPEPFARRSRLRWTAGWTNPCGQPLPPSPSSCKASPTRARSSARRQRSGLLYDDEYIYVGAWLWDEGEVQNRMSRKDGAVPDADFFVVLLDSYHDHRTAFRFGTWPSGVKKDQIIIAGGGLQDTSWDPVWDLETTITDEGWFVEMQIPFSQLRYGAADVQSWGFQAERRLRRKGEDVAWAFTPRSEPRGVARYGHLEGIEGIAQGRRLEILPFVTARAEYVQVPRSEVAPFANPFRGGSEYFGNAGLDLKYRVGTNLTLDATVNPDFGQVELDPAVINLTAFETRFAEKRPFFVEGAEIFRFGDTGGRPGGTEAQLVYSRRIGRTPQGSVPDEAEYSDIPGSTTILGAMKLSGKSAGGWSVGILNAVADRVRASWMDAEGRGQTAEVEPRANYLAARLRRDIRQGTGSFGVLATSVHRDLATDALARRLRSSAYSLGVDGRIEWDSQEWMLAGKLSGSRVAGSPDAIVRAQKNSARYMDRPDADHLEFDPTATSLAGVYGKLDLLKQSGAWQGGVGLTAISPGYEVNDLRVSDVGRPDRPDIDVRI